MLSIFGMDPSKLEKELYGLDDAQQDAVKSLVSGYKDMKAETPNFEQMNDDAEHPLNIFTRDVLDWKQDE